ncbi:MAG: Fic family protein [Saprospiraceae bacterium]|jgi:Fic family protein
MAKLTIETIIDVIRQNGPVSSGELNLLLKDKAGYATIKRRLTELVEKDLVSLQGSRKSTKYFISAANDINAPINTKDYFKLEIDQRKIKKNYQFDLTESILPNHSLFKKTEIDHLNQLQNKYLKNIKELSHTELNKELERLAVDLSWKSSQIEGNTYSLLETERLLKEKITAEGKTHEEAVMLLNHKDALDFIVEYPDYVSPLTVKSIEDIHKLLTKDLGIDQNIRKRRVGISGTNYEPLVGEFQIKEALQDICLTVNHKDNVFEKSFITLIMLSYLQAFADGNKRTARITSNAVLINHNYCPLSFRTVDSIEYKKAMLIFYEQNNISPFKEIFIDQYQFAVETYF